MRYLSWLILVPLSIFALEVQPWFGDVYEFHLLSSYIYSRFHQVQNSRPPFDQLFQSNLIYFDLDFSPSSVWSIDGDIQFADTTKMSFNFRTMALQARYLWLDDIIGDPLSFATGASARGTTNNALRDVSCPSFANFDFELNFSMGKEFDSSASWLWRTWFFGAVGHGTRGSPWVRAILALETNVHDQHKFALYAAGVNSYGRHTHIDVDDFFGYAKVREKTIDIGARYGCRVGVYGTIRFEYIRRVLAKSAPKDVNSFAISYLFPFSF